MHRITPGKYFAISRKLPDPNDSTTYYIRAVIRNAETDALIETVDLTDRGNRRFSYRWQAIANVPEDGLYISIETTVYTDSGYTTKSDSYQEELETYQVKHEVMHVGGSMGLGREDWKKLRLILVELFLANKPKAIDYAAIRKSHEKNTEKIVSLLSGQASAMTDMLASIATAVKGIKLEPQDLSSILGAITKGQEMVRNMHDQMLSLPEPILEAIGGIKPTDLTEVLSKLDAGDKNSKELAALIKNNSKAHLEKKMKEFFAGIPDIVGDPVEEPEEPEEIPYIPSVSDVHVTLRSKNKTS